jgi:hypothetical protein
MSSPPPGSRCRRSRAAVAPAVVLRLSLGPIVVLALLVVGVGLRLLGFFDPALQLWLDEASWAEMLVDQTATWIRPAGYMKLCGFLVEIENTEVMLRLPSLLAGLVTLPLFAAVLRRWVSWPWVSVGTFLLAIHPVAVSMSKEFKPYAVEAMLHVALLWAAVRWLDEKKTRDLLVFLSIAVVAPFFAWSVVFAYPGIFAVVFATAARERRRDATLAVVSGATLTMLVLAVIFSLRVADEDAKARFWGRKYDVFYIGDSIVDGWLWGLRKTAEVAGFPGRLALAGPLRAVESVLPIVAAVVVVVALVALVVGRRWRLLVLLGGPWVLTLVFNALAKWPYGVFRTNLYLLPLVIGLLVVGLAEAHALLAPSGTAPPRRRWVIAGAVVTALALAPWDLSRFRVKEPSSLALGSSVRTALEQIVADQPPTTSAPVEIALDGHACGIFRYYTRLHAVTRHTLGPAFATPDRFRVQCGGFTEPKWRALLERTTPTWILVAKEPFVGPTRELGTRRCGALAEQSWPSGTTLFRCTQRKPSLTAPEGPVGGGAAADDDNDDNDNDNATRAGSP